MGTHSTLQGELATEDGGAFLYHDSGLTGSIVDYLVVSPGVDRVQRLKPCP